MRYIFVPAFASFFLFSSVAPGETITNESVIERDGLYYKKGATEPFTGKIANDLNHDKILGKFKHGKRDGLWEFYHPNGQLRAKGKYKDGKYHGYWEWSFSDGSLESKGPFKDGKYEGYWVNHYNNNQLRWEGVYSKGKRVGPWVWFYPNGGIVEKSNYMYEQPGVRIGQRVKYHQMANSWKSAIIGTEGERVLGYFMKKMEPNVSTKALTVMIRALASIETGLKSRNKLIACGPLLI